MQIKENSHPTIAQKSFFAKIDVDECNTTESNQCDPNAVCNNTEGSYTCRCRRGYMGDGTKCTGKM